MTKEFQSPLAGDLREFLEFKRKLGYRYARVPATLRSIDRFFAEAVKKSPKLQVDQIWLGWLARRAERRKPISIVHDISVARQVCAYLRRRHPDRGMLEPAWPKLPTKSNFVPSILSISEVRILLRHAEHLRRPAFRTSLYRTLILVLYCTGLRIGEALGLRLQDVDLRSGTFFIAESKGRSRWVPFHRSLAVEIRRYFICRQSIASSAPDAPFFVSRGGRRLSYKNAAYLITSLLRRAGLKPMAGRSGPRLHDLRHTFAVHRLTRWYHNKVDVEARLPWLSAYMGHLNMLGTETYLTSTPALLSLANHRFRRRFLDSARLP
jgi:integrase